MHPLSVLDSLVRGMSDGTGGNPDSLADESPANYAADDAKPDTSTPERQLEVHAPVREQPLVTAGATAPAPEAARVALPHSSVNISALPEHCQESSLHPPSPRPTPPSPAGARNDKRPSITHPGTLALSESPQRQAPETAIAAANGNNSSPQQSSQSSRPRNRALGDAPRLDGGGYNISSQNSSVIPGEKRGLGKAVDSTRELLDESAIDGAEDELELSVPSHQEHLTADGQR